jgi:hypothetical protein
VGLIWAGAAVPLLPSYRLLWIGGRFGGHKTSLAFYLAEHYLRAGYRLVTNVHSCWGDDLDSVQLDQDGKLKAVIVLDEGGIQFKSSKQIEMIAAYARKMDVIYIIPSFWPPSRVAQVFTIQPIFNFIATGIPVIVYRWRVRLGAWEDKGWFLWSNPSEIYGIYSTADPGDSADAIISFLITRTQQYRRRAGYEISTMGETETSEVDILADAVSGLSDAADQMASIPRRKNRR